jgi:hypothetical protein
MISSQIEDIHANTIFLVGIEYFWVMKGDFPVTVKIRGGFGGETIFSEPLMVIVKCQPGIPQKPEGPTDVILSFPSDYSSISYDEDGDLIQCQWKYENQDYSWSVPLNPGIISLIKTIIGGILEFFQFKFGNSFFRRYINVNISKKKRIRRSCLIKYRR